MITRITFGISIFLSVLVRLSAAASFGPPITVPSADESDEVAAVQDGAGQVHALTIFQESALEEQLLYHLFNGESWQEPEVIDSAGDLRKVDLAIDTNGTLHASLFRGSAVRYYQRSSDGPWLRDTISAIGASNDSRAGTSIAVSITSDGTVIRHVAYTGGVTSDRLQYARSSDGQNWDIEEAAADPALAPSISAEPWPRAGLQLSNASPVIAYTDRDSDAIRVVYLNTTFFPSPSSSWTDPYEVAPEGGNSRGRGPQLKIRDGVAHLIFEGSENPATESETLRYYRRAASFGQFGQFISETIEEIRPSTDTSRLSLALDPNGIPHAAFVDARSSQPWQLLAARRDGADRWSTSLVLNAPLNEAGEPDGVALTFDPLGRRTVVATRENSVDTEAFRETGTATAASSIEDPDGVESNTIPSILPDGLGGAYVAYIDSNGTPVLKHVDPDGVELEEVTLNDGRGTADRGQIQMVSRGGDKFALAYVTVIGEQIGSTIYLHVYWLDGTTINIQSEVVVQTSGIGFTPGIALEADGGNVLLVKSLDSPLIGDGGSTELIVFNSGGLRDSAAEAAFTDGRPPYLSRPAIDAFNGNLVVVGRDENRLTASIFDPADGDWKHGETVETFDDAGAVPNSFDVVVRAPSPPAVATLAAVAFADGSDLKLSYRLANTNWSVRNIGRLSGVPLSAEDSAFVRLENSGDPRDFHLGRVTLAGTSTSAATYASFTDPNNLAVNPNTFLEPEDFDLGFVDSFDLAIDRHGNPYAAAFDSNSGTIRVILPTASRDDDRDGLPLLLEKALARDPGVPDSSRLLDLDTSLSADGEDLVCQLSYDRPAGESEIVLGANVNVGIFSYKLQSSATLAEFLRPANLPGIRDVGSLPPESSDRDGAVRQRFQLIQDRDIFADSFYRLQVTER